jgi:hypothetical protein
VYLPSLYSPPQKGLSRSVGQQRDVARALDGFGKHTLVRGARTRDAARQNLTAFRYVVLQQLHIFKVDQINLLDAEAANLATVHATPAATASATVTATAATTITTAAAASVKIVVTVKAAITVIIISGHKLSSNLNQRRVARSYSNPLSLWTARFSSPVTNLLF